MNIDAGKEKGVDMVGARRKFGWENVDALGTRREGGQEEQCGSE